MSSSMQQMLRKVGEKTVLPRSLLSPTAFQSHTAVNAVSFLTLLFIGWLDYITGYEFGFFIFYFIPVSISAWYCGKRPGLVIACASAVCWYLSDLYTHHPYSKTYFIYWEMLMRLGSFLTTALTLSRIRAFVLNEVRLFEDLKAARIEISHLRELLEQNGDGSRLEQGDRSE